VCAEERAASELRHAAPKVTISKSKKKKALAAAAAAETAEKAAAAEKAAKEKESARLLAAAESGGAVPMSPISGYGSDEEAKSDRSRSSASPSRTTSFASASTTTINRPKVVSNLAPPTGQARNPMAEQFAKQAMDQSEEEIARVNERASERGGSISSQQSAPMRYGSFSGANPPAPAPSGGRYQSFSGTPSSQAAPPSVPASARAKGYAPAPAVTEVASPSPKQRPLSVLPSACVLSSVAPYKCYVLCLYVECEGHVLRERLSGSGDGVDTVVWDAQDTPVIKFIVNRAGCCCE
jgi:hypothetical protein